MRLANCLPCVALVWVVGVSCTEDTTTQPTEVATVSLGTPAVVLSVREPRLLTASFRDASGNVIGDLTPAWTSSNNAIVSVDQEGNLFGVALGGPVTITVTADGKSASTPMTVVPASIAISPGTATLVLGTTRQLTGTPLDFEGAPIAVDGGVTWLSSNNGVATVSPTGLLTTVAVGNTVITATAAGRTTPLNLETGVPTALDGHWAGTTTVASPSPAKTYPIAFDVVFGSLRSFRLTFASGATSPCGLELVASSAGQTPVVNSTFQVTLNPPQNNGVAPGVVSGVFTSNSTMTADQTAMNFGSYSCPVPGGGTSGVAGALQSGTVAAAKQ